MIKKVLVANRGEIAVRVIRTLREMGITSVAVYSSADRYSLHAELADEAICIGPANSTDSYANPLVVLNAALISGADAVHPGYGFLSERSDFAKLCEETGIEFIGPDHEIIKKMGDKQHARETMRDAGVPTIPGSDGLIDSLEEAYEVADKVGYPVMLKASDGGGGMGMRRVQSRDDLESKYKEVVRETQSVYGNKRIYLEKIIYPAKHIEVQILADKHGNVVHLGERDCSLQRNNQKVLEITPAPSLSQNAREAICSAAVKACKALGYSNAGTIEFLVDQEENFYFLEMNTRLQVEHTISEMVTGIDIVKAQVEIAMGKELAFKQDDIEFSGYAMECRLNAEDPDNNFRPSAGHVDRLIMPSGGIGLRVDTALFPDCDVPPFYDSMIAKIIAHQPTFDETFTLMSRALYEVVVDGIDTNINLLEALVHDKKLRQDYIHTNWLEEELMPRYLRVRQIIERS